MTLQCRENGIQVFLPEGEQARRSVNAVTNTATICWMLRAVATPLSLLPAFVFVWLQGSTRGRLIPTCRAESHSRRARGMNFAKGLTITRTERKQPMRTVRIGSHEINIPDTQLDGLTGARFKELANVPSDKVLIERGPNGNQVVRNDAPLDLTSGQQFLEVNRFRTAGRNIGRVNEEMRLLVTKYGDDQVFWPEKLEWVLICNWPLPAGWSRSTTDLIIFLPDNYGFGASLRDCVIDPGLKFYADSEWVEPPHYYGGEKKYMPESSQKARACGLAVSLRSC